MVREGKTKGRRERKREYREMDALERTGPRRERGPPGKEDRRGEAPFWPEITEDTPRRLSVGLASWELRSEFVPSLLFSSLSLSLSLTDTKPRI